MSMDAYDPNEYPAFAVTVDLVILTVRPPSLEVLLVRRPEGPQRGHWALPGGFVKPDQDLPAAAESKLSDKTSWNTAPSPRRSVAPSSPWPSCERCMTPHGGSVWTRPTFTAR